MCQLNNGILTIGLVVWLWALSVPAHATTIVLDNTNGYQAVLELGATIQQPSAPTGSFFITGTSLEFAIGTAATAVFSGQTQIGGGSKLGGFRPEELVSDNVDFAIRTSIGNLYDAHLTYFATAGTPPIPNNDAGAVFEVTLFVIPEPSTALLLASGLMANGSTKRRPKKRFVRWWARSARPA